MSERQTEQVEHVFGRFRQPLREGRLETILLCSGLVFAVNTVGDFINFTLPGTLVLPAGTLVLGGWSQGMSFATIHASSFVSPFLFLLVGCLE